MRVRMIAGMTVLRVRVRATAGMAVFRMRMRMRMARGVSRLAMRMRMRMRMRVPGSMPSFLRRSLLRFMGCMRVSSVGMSAMTVRVPVCSPLLLMTSCCLHGQLGHHRLNPCTRRQNIGMLGRDGMRMRVHGMRDEVQERICHHHTRDKHVTSVS